MVCHMLTNMDKPRGHYAKENKPVTKRMNLGVISTQTKYDVK